jgi:hypothetical protein
LLKRGGMAKGSMRRREGWAGFAPQGFLRFDSWPDMSEFDDDELCPTNLRYSNGAIAGLYSAANSKTVDRHFRWMASHSIDGVWKQRFLCDVGAPGPKRDFNDRVTANVAAAAAASGRVWALMYDVSGADPDTLLEHVKSDWSHLVSRLKILDGDRYLHHRGAPILAIWGLGANSHGRNFSVTTAIAIQDHFASLNVTLMGGVPTGWRDLTRDSQTDPRWHDVYRRFAVISPWTVGRYTSADNQSPASVDKFLHEYIIPDMAAAKAAGADYLPVVFPGDSAHYEPRQPPENLNHCPRNGGTFLWRQLWNALSVAKVDMLYGAMYDEVSEGTAFYKIASRKNQTPANAAFLFNDVDAGVDNLPSLKSDWWLELASHASAHLRGGPSITKRMPSPPSPAAAVSAARRTDRSN